MAKRSSKALDENRAAIRAGQRMAETHPLIAPLPNFTLHFMESEKGGDAGWLFCACEPPPKYAYNPINIPTPRVRVSANLRRRAPVEEWAHVVARMAVHIVLNHLDPAQDGMERHAARWVAAERLVAMAGVGRRPAEWPPVDPSLPSGGEEALEAFFRERGVPSDVAALSLGRPGRPFWSFSQAFTISEALRADRRRRLAQGVRQAATAAVATAHNAQFGGAAREDTVYHRALRWVIAEYPLLAALASSFTLVVDAEICARMDVSTAAIDDAAQEIYVHPKLRLGEAEAKFVMAHELLHAGLRHTARRQGRDAWYWNIACDYVINAWLLQMGVGAPPEQLGYNYDPALDGLSAEEIYDRIVSDLRWMRKLKAARTMNGSAPDMLEGERSSAWWRGGGCDLDAFYRRALNEGLELHRGVGRGLLPAGLVEEIRALAQPPIPWDVQLGQWLDQFFPPIERRRSFARAHRRQSATPEIPRPARIDPLDRRASRVFGAVVDTSGSMSRVDLGKAVGALASYGMSREVAFIRLIQCDAAAHDAGYVEPEALLERVSVKGRGGTRLMPGLNMIERAEDFPKDGPILVITDGDCDRIETAREHAFLLPAGRRTPFPTKRPVFHFA